MTMLTERLGGVSARLGARAPKGLLAAIVVCSGLGVSHAHAQELNGQGWSVLEPSVDTRFIFVSSSTGNDSKNGLSPSKAVKTLERAKELMRDGSPDWLLLKRGDVWRETFGTWGISGRSADERVVISSYGESDERPKLIVGDNGIGLTGKMNADVSHVAIVGIAMVAERAPDDSSSMGIRWLSTGEDLLIEDCYIEGFKDNVVCQAVNGRYNNFAIRRSVVVDSWSTAGHSQGLYVSGTDGVRIEQNLFDHNGWSTSVSGANPTQFNQNVYLATSVYGVEFNGNMTARASGAGVQMRNGGDARANVSYANPIAMRFGYSTLEWPDTAATGSLIGNVVVGGEMSDTSISGSGTGMWIERVDDTLVKNNVVTHFVEGSVVWAYTLNGFAGDVRYEGNVSYDYVSAAGSGRALKTSAQVYGDASFSDNRWHMDDTNMIIELRHVDGMRFVDNDMAGFEPSEDVFFVAGSVMNYHEWQDSDFVNDDNAQEFTQFPDAGRDLEAYAQLLGYSDEAALLAAARGMSRANWDYRLTGEAAADWIRAGYIVED